MRVTGSGLGCPTWPECVDGSITPTVEQAEGFHKYIEFGNRTLTGVLGILALATVLAVWAWAPRRAMKVAARRRARRGRRPGRPRRVHRAARPAPRDRGRPLPRVDGRSSWRRPTSGSPGTSAAAAPVAARAAARLPPRVGDLRRSARLVLALGTVVTGSGPALGGRRRARAVRPRRPHRVVAARRRRHALPRPRRRDVARRAAHGRRRGARARCAPGSSCSASRWPRALIGYVQYFTDLPEALVMAHMLGASLLVVALTHGVLALRRRPTRMPSQRSTASRPSPSRRAGRPSARPAPRPRRGMPRRAWRGCWRRARSPSSC